jgi:hypothetical protein
MNELQHRVPKQERIFAVIKPPRHFRQVRQEDASQSPMPNSHNPAPSAPRLAAFEMCDAASVLISAT